MFKVTKLAAAIGAAMVLPAVVQAEESYTFDEVVVSSTRSQKTIEDTAASVQVVTDQELEENLAQNVSDVFDYMPGVTVQSDSRQGIQGINIRGMEGNRIKILVDGVSQPNQFENNYSFINSGRVDLDVDMLKSVEVVKGAASSLQGSDAVGGIVAFQTKDPADFIKDGKTFGGHVKLGYSSADNSFKESVAIANRVGKLETLVAYTRQDGEEVDNFGEQYDQDSSADNILVKLQYQANEDHRIEFTGEYVTKNVESDLTNSPSNSSNSYNPYLGDDTSDKTRLGIKHIWFADTTAFDTLTWQFDYLAKEENGITNRTKMSNGNVQKKDYIYEDKGYQADIQLEKNLTIGSADHFIVYGASFSAKDIENVNKEYNSVGSDTVVFYMPDASEQRYGAFVQDEISFGRWIVTPGLRFDSYKTDPGNQIPSGNTGGFDKDSYSKYSDSAVTGRLGTMYAINNEHKIFGQISQGFRAPDFQELFYSFSNPGHGYTSVPNADLKAEESISYELGWRHNTDTSSTELAVFYSDYDNFIDRVGKRNSNTGLLEYSYQNVDEAVIKGIELANTYYWDNIAEGLSSRVAAAYTEGEDGDNKPLNSVNPWNAVFGVSYDAPVGNWGTSLKVAYTAAKKESDITPSQDFSGNDNPVFAPDSSTVVDLTAYYIPMEDLTLRAGVFNLTDEEYYNWNDVRSLQKEDKFYTQAGRNFAITAKYEF
ncbi:TonB-dependent hemoglobin/transferrin/lactoferrin family receptor [Vibrio sp. HN007]|uniref:TonB-dependent hemoglobin/transferrin/lactoferrin family receptor n=1 Tax=Vibrio iocasae TaxID=3098914 RepID=UPI0035D4A2B8